MKSDKSPQSTSLQPLTAEQYSESVAGWVKEHREVLSAGELSWSAPLGKAVETCATSLLTGGKLMFFGNGGSAADAQHLATELTVRYRANRRALAAIALTTDSSALTAIGNDLSFDELFSRQIEAIGKPGDVALGLSTSGNSPNVIRAVKQARSMEIHTIGFAGRDGGALGPLVDILLLASAQATARTQEMHIFLGHMFCELLERRLGLAP